MTGGWGVSGGQYVGWLLGKECTLHARLGEGEGGG